MNSSLEEAKQRAIKMLETKWVKWVHELKPPAYTEQKKKKYADLAKSDKSHCAICLNLNGCCFTKNKTPPHNLHENCHCNLISIPGITAKAEENIEKFSNYVFDWKKNKGKMVLFQDLGYSIIDSKWLDKEFRRQAKIKYETDDFVLGDLDVYGQRINIKIELPSKDGKQIKNFKSGWMVYPDGVIKLVTPFGGFWK